MKMQIASKNINLVDSDGMEIDEWEINKKGEVTNRIPTKKHDAFYMVDDNGKRLGGIENEKVFDYGTIEKQKTQFYARDEKKETYDFYRVRGDNNGTEMFEFLASNINVEWSQAKLGIERDKGLNYLTTSHLDRKEYGMENLVNGQLQYGYIARELNHNHPINIGKPSGLPGTKRAGTGDIGFAKYMTKIFGNNVKLHIYTPGSLIKYTPFGPNSTKKDF